MSDPLFAAAMSNVETYLRAARSAAETGDSGAVSGELVQAALTLGTQIGNLQARFAASYSQTPQAKIVTRALRGLNVTAIKAFARVDAVREQASLGEVEEEALVASEHETPYAGDANEYLP